MFSVGFRVESLGSRAGPLQFATIWQEDSFIQGRLVAACRSGLGACVVAAQIPPDHGVYRVLQSASLFVYFLG